VGAQVVNCKIFKITSHFTSIGGAATICGVEGRALINSERGRSGVRSQRG